MASGHYLGNIRVRQEAWLFPWKGLQSALQSSHFGPSPLLDCSRSCTAPFLRHSVQFCCSTTLAQAVLLPQRVCKFGRCLGPSEIELPDLASLGPCCSLTSCSLPQASSLALPGAAEAALLPQSSHSWKLCLRHFLLWQVFPLAFDFCCLDQ